MPLHRSLRAAFGGPFVPAALFVRRNGSDIAAKKRNDSGSQVVTAKDYIVDPSQLDFDHVIADREEIRKYNPQRFEMEQLTAVVYEDVQRFICAGFKDVTDREIWVRGHMPGMPLMPGVFMCEAAAQLCSYFTQRHDLLGADMVGLGGMENVYFRGRVVPGDRLVIACGMTRVRRGRMIVCQFQGFVGDGIVVEGCIKGIPLPRDAVGGASDRD